MNRSDRLLRLIALLRDGRLWRAADLARALGVSQRTIYRDVETAQASGVEITGTRGEGYRLAAPILLPQLALSVTELEALHLGLAVVTQAADADLRAAALSLADKIDAHLPIDRDGPPRGWTFPTDTPGAASGLAHLAPLRGAIRARQKLRIDYDGRDGPTTRTIRPLQMEYWGQVWTLGAWCELRGGFRTFRIDRIARLQILPELFVNEPGISLEDYLEETAASGPHPEGDWDRGRPRAADRTPTGLMK